MVVKNFFDSQDDFLEKLENELGIKKEPNQAESLFDLEPFFS